jgi:hypothetical protein
MLRKFLIAKDGGKTWNTLADLDYHRVPVSKKNASDPPKAADSGKWSRIWDTFS